MQNTQVDIATGLLRSPFKWRVFGLISLIMAALLITFLSLVSQMTESRFETGRQAVHEQYEAQFGKLVEASSERLIQLSSAVSLNRSLMEALVKGQGGMLESELGELDWNLQADGGISVGALYDRSGQPVFQQDRYFDPDKVRKVLFSEQALGQVTCERECQIESYTALLYQGGVAGAMVLSEPLSNVMLRLKHVAGIDSALLVNGHSRLESSPSVTETSSSGFEKVDHWGLDLIALTDSEKMAPIVSVAASQFELDGLYERVNVLDYDGQLYEFKAMPVGSASVIVISNVSEDYSLMDQSQDLTLRYSLYALIIAELLLLGFLRKPLKRLALAQDVVAQVDVQNARLDSVSQALDRERRVLESLSDTISVGVLTLDAKGCVRTINPYFKKVLGLSNAALSSKTLVEFLETDAHRLSKRLDQIKNGILAEYEITAPITAANGERYEPIWRFVPVYQNSEEQWSESERDLLVIVSNESKLLSLGEKEWRETHDSLTGALNMSAGLAFVQREIESSEPSCKLFVLFRLASDFMSPSAAHAKVLSEFIKTLGAHDRVSGYAALLAPNEVLIGYENAGSFDQSGMANQFYTWQEQFNAICHAYGLDKTSLNWSCRAIKANDRHALEVVQDLRQTN